MKIAFILGDRTIYAGYNTPRAGYYVSFIRTKHMVTYYRLINRVFDTFAIRDSRNRIEL